MSRNIGPGLLWLALVTLSVPICAAQQPAAATPPAPVPSQIISAKKVFISNAGGEEVDPRVFFLPTITINEAYDKFYAAVKSGGRFEPVFAPAGADLILEIRFRYQLVPNADNVGGDSAGPHLRVAILDPRTNVLLWALSRQVVASSGPHNKEKRVANFDQAIAALAGDLNLLSSQPAPPAGSAHKQ
jgi:hypothetical protein